MDGSKNGQGFVIGFLIGAVAGVAAALLMAPQSGKETRQTIGHKSMELKDQATKQAQRLASDAKGQVEYVQEKGRVVISGNAQPKE